MWNMMDQDEYANWQHVIKYIELDELKKKISSWLCPGVWLLASKNKTPMNFVDHLNKSSCYIIIKSKTKEEILLAIKEIFYIMWEPLILQLDKSWEFKSSLLE